MDVLFYNYYMLNFKRPMNYVDWTYMSKTYGEEYSLDKLNYFKLRSLRKLEDKYIVEKYLFNILNNWVQKNYSETEAFASKLKKYIRKLHLDLNFVEKDQLLILDERTFSLERHIKGLEINTDLQRREKAGAKFLNARLFLNGDLFDEGNLILTNKRVIFEGKGTHLFNYTSARVGTNEKGLVAMIDNNTYVFSIHDQITLENTFKNILGKKKVVRNEI